MARGIGAGAQCAGLVAAVDDLERFGRGFRLQHQLGHFHELAWLLEQVIGQLQAVDVDVQTLRVAWLTLHTVQQVGPVLGFWIACCQLLDGADIAGRIVFLELDIGQHAELIFAQAATFFDSAQFLLERGGVALLVVVLQQVSAQLWIILLLEQVLDGAVGFVQIAGAHIDADQAF